MKKSKYFIVSLLSVLLFSFSMIFSYASSTQGAHCYDVIFHTHSNTCTKCGSSSYKITGYECCNVTDTDQFDFKLPASKHFWVDSDNQVRKCSKCGNIYKGPVYAHKTQYGTPGWFWCW